MTSLRERSVSRVPCLSFLLHHLQLSSPKFKASAPRSFAPTSVSRSSTFYVLNPSGDLPGTQETFERLFEQEGWRGVAGRMPQEGELARSLLEEDVLVYCGHGGGER